jgi:hypothetical protein
MGDTGPGPAGTIAPGDGNAFKTPITVEGVMNSRMIDQPFQLLQCCLVTDGGGLSWEDADDKVWASYNTFRILRTTADPDGPPVTSPKAPTGRVFHGYRLDCRE